MDVVNLISSVSKLAIIAFVITLGIVAYEVMVIMKKRKEEKTMEEKDVKLPEFKGENQNEKSFTPIALGQAAMQPLEIGTKKISKPFIPLLLGLGVLIVIAVGVLIYRRNQVTSVNVDVNEDVSPVAEVTQAPDEDSIPVGDFDAGTDVPITPGEQTGTVATPTEAEKVADDTVTPTVVLAQSETTPYPTTLITQGAEDSGTSVTPTTSETTSVSPTTTQTTLTPTSVVTGSVTTTSAPTDLPEAGAYQPTLIISVAALAVIYLALIL